MNSMETTIISIFLSFSINHKLQHKLHKKNNLPDVTLHATAPRFHKDSGDLFALVKVYGTSWGRESFVATVIKPHLHKQK